MSILGRGAAFASRHPVGIATGIAGAAVAGNWTRLASKETKNPKHAFSRLRKAYHRNAEWNEKELGTAAGAKYHRNRRRALSR